MIKQQQAASVSLPPPILGHSCRVVTGTACGRLRSVPLSFPKPFHQVPDGLPGTRTCSLMPVSRLFGGLFFTMDRIAAGTQRLSGCRLLSLPVAACAVTGTACPAFGLFPQRLFCCFYVSLHGRQKPSSASLPFFSFEDSPEAPAVIRTLCLPGICRTGGGSFSACLTRSFPGLGR